MLKHLAIAWVLLVGSLVHVDAQESRNPAADTQASKHPSASAPPIVAKQADAPALQTNSNQKQGGSRDQPLWIALPPKDLYDWIGYGANLLLVVVGIGTLSYIAKQVRVSRETLTEIKTQAGHMASQIEEMKAQTAIAQSSATAARKSADAALLNAQAVIASERPLLTVEPRSKTGEFFEIVATNCGKSPAEILVFGSDLRIFGNQFGPPLPVTYQVDDLVLTVKIVVPPGGEEVVSTMPLMISSIREGAPEDMQKVRAFQKFLFMWGTVKYQSALSKERKGIKPYETRWCFRYTPGDGVSIPPSLQRDGAMQYNEHT